jgi:hypothetical protein
MILLEISSSSPGASYIVSYMADSEDIHRNELISRDMRKMLYMEELYEIFQDRYLPRKVDTILVEFVKTLSLNSVAFRKSRTFTSCLPSSSTHRFCKAKDLHCKRDRELPVIHYMLYFESLYRSWSNSSSFLHNSYFPFRKPYARILQSKQQ